MTSQRITKVLSIIPIIYDCYLPTGLNCFILDDTLYARPPLPHPALIPYHLTFHLVKKTADLTLTEHSVHSVTCLSFSFACNYLPFKCPAYLTLVAINQRMPALTQSAQHSLIVSC